MYYVVERSIVVLKPKEPFLNWINTYIAISDETILDLASIRIDCNSYLIPEVNEIEDGISYIDEVYEGLFQLELASWSEDQSTWPEDLSLKTFWEWFDVEISPTLIDLTEDNSTSLTEEVEEPPLDTIH